MSDNKEFKNPYLEGAQPTDPRLDYRKIMEEYRARRVIETGLPSDMNVEDDPERMILPELQDGREPRTGNRFAFDLKKDVTNDIDINDIRSIRKVSYGDSYRPRKSRANIHRNYAGLADLESVASDDVRATINSSRKRAGARKKSPVSAPAETIEQKRARIEAMLPTPDEQKELDKIMEQRGKLYVTPSFMRDELKIEAEPTVNDTDIITPLRTNIQIPGFSFRQRYMNKGLEDANIPQIPTGPYSPEGFGGNGGDLPEFESEASNWSLRPDSERFTNIETKDRYDVIPMGGIVNEDKRQMFRAKVRLGNKKTASAFEAGAGSIKSAHSERLAGELASKRKRSRLRIASAMPETLMSAPLPAKFTDLSQMDSQAENEAHKAGLAAGKALALAALARENAKTAATPADGQVWHDDAAQFAPQSMANSNLAPTENTFMDGNFEKPKDKGMINRSKSTYTYLFDENEEIPDNITNYDKKNYTRTGGQGSTSEYGFLFLSDEDIDNQINNPDGLPAQKTFVEPVGMSEAVPAQTNLGRAVRDPITMTSFDEAVTDTENTESSRFKLTKGNISFAPLEKDPDAPVSEAVNADLPADPSQMPDARRYAQGFSSLGGAAFEKTEATAATAATFAEPTENTAAAGAIFAQDFVQAANPVATEGGNVLMFTGGAEVEAQRERKQFFEDSRAGLYDKIRELIFTAGSGLAVLAVLLVFELLPQVGVKMPEVLTPSVPAVYYGVSAVLMVLCTVFFRKTIFGGFSDIFSGHPTYKSYSSLAFAATAVQLVLAGVNAFSGKGEIRVYPAALVFCLLVLCLGQIFKVTRIGTGLTFISADKQRGTMLMADAQEGSHVIAEASGLHSGSNVAYHAAAQNLNDYFEYANEPDLSESTSSKLFWWIAVGGAATVVAGWIAAKNFNSAITALTVYSMLSMPFTAAAANNLPLSRLAKKLLRRGGMISGWAAVDEFSDVNVITVNGTDLFPSDAVELIGIKTFGDKRIDRAILDAAALSITIGGTLGTVFYNVIHGETSVLSEVEAPQYEAGLGMSGYVKGRKILIGSKLMLERNGVETPGRDYDKMYEQEGSKLVYLSSNGELSAMFVLKYHADETTREHMRELADCGVNIAINTSDVNITPDMVARTFGIRPEYISVIPWTLNSTVEKLTGTEKKDAPAVVGTNRSVSAIATVLASVIRVKSSLVLSVVLQTMGMIVGALFSIFMAFTGNVTDFSPSQVILYAVIWTVAVLIVPNIKRILK